MKSFQTSDTVTWTMRKKWFYTLVVAEIIVLLAALTMIGWGYYQHWEVDRLREENELHQRQVEIANQKLTELQTKMQRLDALDAEVRQMIQGSQAGTAPQGDGGTVAREPAATQAVTPGALLERITALSTHAEQRFNSLVMLRQSLAEGIDLTPVYHPLPNDGATSDTPSIWPAQGYVSSSFGWRNDPFSDGIGFHEGVDIAGDYGSPIQATANGTVTAAGWAGGYGYMVEITHPGGIVTRYGHNSLIIAEVGDKVQTGTVISFMGSTGRSTGSHVHYEVRVDGVPVDPMLFLPTKK